MYVPKRFSYICSPFSLLFFFPVHHFILFIYLFLTSLLEYNCFTMVCKFLLYNKVNQLYSLLLFIGVASKSLAFDS